MDKNQKINCTVENCEFNNTEEQQCELKEIKVCNCKELPDTGEAQDESMCASYKCNCGCLDK